MFLFSLQQLLIVMKHIIQVVCPFIIKIVLIQKHMYLAVTETIIVAAAAAAAAVVVVVVVVVHV